MGGADEANGLSGCPIITSNGGRTIARQVRPRYVARVFGEAPPSRQVHVPTDGADQRPGRHCADGGVAFSGAPVWIAIRLPGHTTSNWARQDSNLRPIDYESTALTAELRARDPNDWTAAVPPPQSAELRLRSRDRRCVWSRIPDIPAAPRRDGCDRPTAVRTDRPAPLLCDNTG